MAIRMLDTATGEWRDMRPVDRVNVKAVGRLNQPDDEDEDEDRCSNCNRHVDNCECCSICNDPHSDCNCCHDCYRLRDECGCSRCPTCDERPDACECPVCDDCERVYEDCTCPKCGECERTSSRCRCRKCPQCGRSSYDCECPTCDECNHVQEECECHQCSACWRSGSFCTCDLKPHGQPPVKEGLAWPCLSCGCDRDYRDYSCIRPLTCRCHVDNYYGADGWLVRPELQGRHVPTPGPSVPDGCCRICRKPRGERGQPGVCGGHQC